MPTTEFLDKFLGPPAKNTPSLHADHFKTVAQTGTETDMYNRFITLANRLIPKYKIVNTG
ncbi:hypothetical protein C0995_007409, partial [Termitomyces sp. Mi166